MNHHQDVKLDAQILIVEEGGQLTHVIERKTRENLKVKSIVLPPEKAEAWLRTHTPKGIIISGSGKSVLQPEAPKLPQRLLTTNAKVLGICFGMQQLAHTLGGKVESSKERKEYGRPRVELDTKDPLFRGISPTIEAVMSHGDSVGVLPRGFRKIASTQDCPIVAISSEDGKYWGVQFHPEADHTQFGTEILKNFVYEICGCVQDWEPEDIVGNIREEVLSQVGNNPVVMGFSGGVDSTTLATILQPELKGNLLCFLIDTGALREYDLREALLNAKAAGVKLQVVDAQSRFIPLLSGVVDAQVKRKIFQEIYKNILEEQAYRNNAKWLIQGSLAPDFIESGATGGFLIKSHHNVGLQTWLKQLHPFRNLFKYQVRGLAESISLPPYVVNRHPFPGPGLLIRVVGQPPTTERVSLVRDMDLVVRQTLEEFGEYDKVAQVVIAMLCVNVVAVKGDERAYSPVVGIRPVQTFDFMTALGYIFPQEVKEVLDTRLMQFPISTPSYREGPKPPHTIEYE